MTEQSIQPTTTSSDIARFSDSNGLPSQCYTDTGFLELEQDQLFRKEWLCAGRAEEIPNPGDYFTLNIVGEPLIVVRSDDGEIRVLANVCRHRNMKVASGHGNRRLFVCPYHAWSYRNDGTLQAAPLMEREKLEQQNCALPSLPCESWNGFIFVSLAADACPESLHTQLADLAPHLDNYHPELMHQVYAAEEIWPCNWKSLVENFMEGYHLSTVHPVSLGNSTPTELCRKLPGGKLFTAYQAHYPDTAVPRNNWHPDTTEEERNCSTLFSVFPGLVVSQSPDVLAWLALTPEGCDTVKVRWGIAALDKELSEEAVQSLIDKWTTINQEDKAKLEDVHRGLKSRYAARGPLAPADFEGTIADFYRYLNSRLHDKSFSDTASSRIG